MITLLFGDNSFEIERSLNGIVSSSSAVAEKFDGLELSPAQLGDIFMGVSLFNDQRLIIVRGLAENKVVFSELEKWLPRLSEHIHLVLVESKIDKRTSVFKALQSRAEVKEFIAWNERDSLKAEAWAIKEADRLGLELNKKVAQHLVKRVGLNQWSLFNSIEILSVAGEVNEAVIDDLIEANPTENVFYLFETALKGDTQKMQSMLKNLSASEDPYRVFGLLVNQLYQLVALIVADKPAREVASDIGAHPFAIAQLSNHAKHMGAGGLSRTRGLISIFAKTDEALKNSAADPWVLIERALIKLAIY